MFVVDDDPDVIASLELLLKANGFPVEGFTSAGTFLSRAPQDEVACVLLDVKMPELNGLDVQQVLRRQGHELPVVFLSGVGDVPTTARAMRDGAVDFLEKPVDEPQLLEALERAFARAHRIQQQRRIERDARQRLGRLTARERQVCDLIAAGLLNKQIAHELGASENTIKVHRSRVMRKVQVESVAALVKLVSSSAPDRES